MFSVYILSMEMNSRKIIKRLKADGWEHLRTEGSHHTFGRGSERITVPHPRKDVSTGVALKIAKDAGWR